MEDLERRLATFFARKQGSRSADLPQGNIRRVKGYLNDYRVREFAHAHRARQLTGGIWSKLSGKVYTLTQDWLSVVLACYDDGAILWLDDHLDDSDFDSFFRREQLIEWLPDHLDDMLEVLLGTKFHFLGWPQLIRHVEEIPLLPEKYKYWLDTPDDSPLWRHVDRQEAIESWRASEERLASIADKVSSPEYGYLDTDQIRISFFVWTKILGNVVKIDVFFERARPFRYDCIQLVEQVGYFTVPR